MDCDTRFVKTNRVFCLTVTTLSCLIVFGCTSTPKLKPSLPLGMEQERIKKTVGVHCAPEFREYKHVADPYHNKHNVDFLVGAASVDLFRSVFSRSFEEVKELDAPVHDRQNMTGVDMIVEPKIKSFRFHSRMAGHRIYWADIIYEMTLTCPSEGETGAWCIRGMGEGIDESSFDEERAWAVPVESAMQDAAAQLADSFREIPEVVRCLRGIPMEGVTAPMESQTVCKARDLGNGSTRVGYDGVVSAEAGFNLETDPEIEKAQAKLKDKGLAAVGLSIKNEGNHRLRVRRSDISLVSLKRKALGPMPCSFFAALATTYNVRLPMVAGGTGYAALPQLIFSLVNLALTHEEKKEAGSYSETFNKCTLTDAVLKTGDVRKGALFFAFPPEAFSTTDLFLFVPVLDIDSATRYILRVPVKK